MAKLAGSPPLSSSRAPAPHDERKRMTRTLEEARAVFATEASLSLQDLVWDRAYIETDRAWLVLYNSREH
jgi:hypothetical protein